MPLFINIIYVMYSIAYIKYVVRYDEDEDEEEDVHINHFNPSCCVRALIIMS